MSACVWTVVLMPPPDRSKTRELIEQVQDVEIREEVSALRARQAMRVVEREVRARHRFGAERVARREEVVLGVRRLHIAGIVDVGLRVNRPDRAVRRAGFDLFEDADGERPQLLGDRQVVGRPRAHAVALIGGQIALREAPRRIEELRILQDVRLERSAADVLAVDVAEKLGQGVVPTGRELGVQPVGSLQRQRRVLPRDGVAVLHERQIELLADGVRHFPRRRVRPVRIEIGELAAHHVGAYDAARADPAADAGRELVHMRRIERAVDLRVHARQLGQPRLAVGPAVGVEPVEQLPQRRLGPDRRPVALMAGPR